MTTCVIVGAIVSCLIDPTTRTTPAEAVAIFSASATPFQYVPEPEWPVRPSGPTVNVMSYDPDWPFPRTSASTFGVDAASMRAGEFLAAYANSGYPMRGYVTRGFYQGSSWGSQRGPFTGVRTLGGTLVPGAGQAGRPRFGSGGPGGVMAAPRGPGGPGGRPGDGGATHPRRP